MVGVPYDPSEPLVYLRMRILMPLTAVAAFAAPVQADAVNVPAITFAVPCTSSSTSTGSLGITLPSGTYAVTVEGACSIGFTSVHSIPLSTCPVTGPPCVDSGGSVTLPGATCNVSAGAVAVGTCYATSPHVNGCGHPGTVRVNGQCLALQTAGLVTHGGGPMVAGVVDSNYGDNVGAFVVTAVLTAL